VLPRSLRSGRDDRKRKRCLTAGGGQACGRQAEIDRGEGFLGSRAWSRRLTGARVLGLAGLEPQIDRGEGAGAAERSKEWQSAGTTS
jgi:hypothetical protein